MAGERVKLQVKERERRGSRDARRLRREGMIPGVLYGNGKESFAISVPGVGLRASRTVAGGPTATLAAGSEPEEAEEGEELPEGEVPEGEEAPEGAAEAPAEAGAEAASGEQGEPGSTPG